jgi:hypothetical protein
MVGILQNFQTVEKMKKKTKKKTAAHMDIYAI